MNDHAAATPATSEPTGAEAVAHALLRLVADHPGCVGRIRACRIVSGMSVPYRDEEQQETFAAYAVNCGWPLRELTSLVDALISGGLVAQAAGPRPTLCLTRPGHRTLDALEQVPASPGD